MLLLLLMALTLSLGAGGSSVSAHASLVEAVPAAGSELKASPERIALTFNERLENGLFYLRVYDSAKKQVTEAAAVMNPEQTTVSLELPPLVQGNFLVTYHVISADGHPVEGSYLFAVGQSLSESADAQQMPAGMQHSHGDEPFGGTSAGDVLQFASRILYYAALLIFTGWLLWYRRFGGTAPEETRTRLRRLAEKWQQLYLIAYILFMWAHLPDLLGDSGAEGLLTLFTKTAAGYAWLGGLLLALLSFVMLYRSTALDLVWAALAWFAKSMLGHAAAFEPKAQTLLLDWLHLGAAAVWAGGLVMLLLLWRTEREQAKRLLPLFSTAALLSLLLLTVSGVLTTFIFLPDIRYIIETSWGRLLLVKCVLVLAVILTGALIRFSYRRVRDRTSGRLLVLDALLMTATVGIVGVFTYLSPLPANEPLHWHVMGEKIHMTAQISPKVPGVNDFTVKVWLPEKLGKPKHVIMKLHSLDGPEIAPLVVPVEPFEDASFEDSYDMKRYSYRVRGAYLPYAGRWKVEVRVMDSEDNETVYDSEIRVY
ncbi:copper resistance CopC/CopD family protein [Paenibacillus sp. S-38]|uniref:copper resistance CopC/CopD family protein n=1 Tax=Paenibacillus sp. S-38 TaxID=3416710 RepID=UPI003CE8D235